MGAEDSLQRLCRFELTAAARLLLPCLDGLGFRVVAQMAVLEGTQNNDPSA